MVHDPFWKISPVYPMLLVLHESLSAAADRLNVGVLVFVLDALSVVGGVGHVRSTLYVPVTYLDMLFQGDVLLNEYHCMTHVLIHSVGQ